MSSTNPKLPLKHYLPDQLGADPACFASGSTTAELTSGLRKTTTNITNGAFSMLGGSEVKAWYIRLSAITQIGFLALICYCVGTVGLWLTETTNAGNIKSFGDAAWCAVTSITTVGYGDRYPVTTAGRFVAAFLFIGGASSFACFAGLMCGKYQDFQKSKNNSVDTIEELSVQIQGLTEQIDKLNKSS